MVCVEHFKAQVDDVHTRTGTTAAENFHYKCDQAPRLSKEVVEYPYLEIIKICLDMVLGSRGPCLSRELYQITSRDPFYPQPFCDSLTKSAKSSS